MRLLLSRLVFAVLLASMAALAGCSLLNRGSAPAPTSAEVVVVGEPGMNLGSVARVHITQLKSDSRFMATPVEAFWSGAAEALQEDLVRIEQDFLLYPGNEKRFDVTIDDQAQYLGIAVDLREPEGNQWRRVIPAAGLRGQQVRVRVGEQRVTVE